MENRLTVDGNVLVAHIASPARPHAGKQSGVVIAHGFPAKTADRVNAASIMSALADYIATETGFAALAFAARGMHDCEGNFSLDGWRRDLAGAVNLLADTTGCEDIWLIGFGTGGALAVILAQIDHRVRGVAALAAPADFDDWARHPRKLLVWSRKVGVVQDPKYPTSFDRWALQLRVLRAEGSARKLDDKNLLVLHGSEDKLVPVLDARAIAAAHPKASLRIIVGADHHLRHDPRAIAVLLGWLGRQRHSNIGGG